jgi:glycosyltransferase involved in cell wall biosynthesis
MHIAIVTAGGAGMFCGSCLHDNAWARALRDAGHEVTLLPMYTPIRVDDENLTSTRVFYGGINVYLDQHVPGWKRLPTWFTRPLDAAWLIKWATSFGISNDARELGEMTVAMLSAGDSPQAREGTDLVRFLTRDLKPDVIVFSNVMLCAEVAQIKAAFSGPVLCVLQGDDVFLDALQEPWRSRVFELLKPITAALDGFLVHSRFYADYMQGYLGIPAEKLHPLPLAIDCRGHTGRPRSRSAVPTIGYFARLAPEKGLRELAQAAVLLNQRRQDFQVIAGGYRPPQHAAYVAEVERLAAPLGNRFRYAGSPDTLTDKVALLETFDVLSVPTPYREPKGLYVLEAWANGVPVVQPAHGHFPELIEEIGGGVCVPPGDATALADALDQLLSDEPRRRQLAQQGWEQVRQRHDLPVLAHVSGELLASLVAAGR